jgi:hypothetical protein
MAEMRSFKRQVTIYQITTSLAVIGGPVEL